MQVEEHTHVGAHRQVCRPHSHKTPLRDSYVHRLNSQGHSLLTTRRYPPTPRTTLGGTTNHLSLLPAHLKGQRVYSWHPASALPMPAALSGSLVRVEPPPLPHVPIPFLLPRPFLAVPLGRPAVPM